MPAGDFLVCRVEAATFGGACIGKDLVPLRTSSFPSMPAAVRVAKRAAANWDQVVCCPIEAPTGVLELVVVQVVSLVTPGYSRQFGTTLPQAPRLVPEADGTFAEPDRRALTTASSRERKRRYLRATLRKIEPELLQLQDDVREEAASRAQMLRQQARELRRQLRQFGWE